MKHILNKKIPTILGIFFILLGILLTTFLLNNQTAFKSRASNSDEPLNVKITNITDTSFTMTYQTPTAVTGSVSYGSDKKLGESELEDVDREKGSFSPKKIHSISVKKLVPSTKYYLTIISGSSTSLNSGNPFEITTGRNISSSSAKQNILKGKIVLPDGSPPPEALVYLSADNSQLLSSTTAKNGTYSFSLKNLRTNDLSAYFNIDENTVFKIVAIDGSLTSSVSTTLGQADSIPTITLSNNYDFAQEFPSVASKSAKSSTAGFPSIASSKKYTKPQIISPKEKQSINSQKPQFRGTSLPNERVEIIIHSDEQITTHITAGGNGNWTYQPPTNLSPGLHTITIKSRDSQGILTTIMQSFTVFAAETTQTTTPTTPSATPTLSASPTLMPLPTQIPTLAIISPTPFSSPTLMPIKSKGGLPPTGDLRIMPITIFALTTTIIGIVLFLLTQKLPL